MKSSRRQGHNVTEPLIRPSSSSPPASNGKLRIIAGRWRGRRLPIAAVQGLRPTGDRIRETLFNWLAPTLVGARCLDLFAGTGALGLEALSRGAAHCVFVERARPAVEALKSACRLLDAQAQSEVVQADSLAWLRRADGEFDLIFLDPPFDSNLLDLACDAIVSSSLLKPRGQIYVETSARSELPQPDGWQLWRAAHAGQVRYGLLTRSTAPAQPG